ncbi:hypothetical protein Taro_035522, partial [Colocasia esculenta]|nr:hypothetical protein [Colocasia esculenta]
LCWFGSVDRLPYLSTVQLQISVSVDSLEDEFAPIWSSETDLLVVDSWSLEQSTENLPLVLLSFGIDAHRLSTATAADLPSRTEFLKHRLGCRQAHPSCRQLLLALIFQKLIVGELQWLSTDESWLESYSRGMDERYGDDSQHLELDPEIWVAAFGAP